MARSTTRFSVVRAILMISALISLAAGATPAAEPIAITSCGQSFKGEAFLTGDLDCSGFEGSAVSIENGTLDLKGFTITGGQLHGILCERRCEIIGGGGTISSAGINGIRNAGRRITIHDLTIEESGVAGVGVPESPPRDWRSRVQVSNCRFVGNGTRGIIARSAEITDSTFSDNGRDGVFIAKSVIVTGSFFSGHSDDGVYSEGKARFIDSVSVGNGLSGVRAVRKADIIDSQIFDNDRAGVTGPRLAISNSSITDNGLWGVLATRWLRVDGSTIIDNGTDSKVCSTVACADLASTRLRGIQGTTCDRSLVLRRGSSGTPPPGVSWGVCTLD